MELCKQTLQDLSELIHRLCGLVIGCDKGYLVRHRLEPLVRGEGLDSFEQFLERLQSRDRARLHDAIIEAITTKETGFFRDRAYFNALRDHVLPERMAMLRRMVGQRHRIRIWSAGCATGQECYSLAMLVRELAAADGNNAELESRFSILASDISAEALEVARAGRYGPNEVKKGLSAALLDRHFHRRGNQWVIDESLRRLVQFQKFDLLDSPAALGGFDVILCRNVLIYFDEPARQRVCRGLYGVLQDGGWLMLGSAESLMGVNEPFESVKVGRVLLYQKPPRSS
jgi:chemotaxis protein methyltransferase CheR